MAKQLRALVTLAEDPRSVPGAHMACSPQLPVPPVSRDLVPSSGLHGHCKHMVHMHTGIHTYT